MRSCSFGLKKKKHMQINDEKWMNCIHAIL